MRFRAAAFLLAASLCAAVSAQESAPRRAGAGAPRIDDAVRRALVRGDAQLNVIVGLREETAADASRGRARAESARRADRVEKERRVLAALPAGSVLESRTYESFSAFSARATRAAVLALSARDDVAWVTVDGVRRALDEPQPSQRLIGSDRANTLGFDGTGQAIAVLDTGVDYSVPDLGGGSFPNSKVVGGTDVADVDADPMDCEGHGTAVASVAAGAAGVAPGSKIVAVKISKNTLCGEAFDSVILSGIDWAVTHREEFHITTINLSFGSAPFDGRDHGFCDPAHPDYAAALDAAAQAGIVLAIAAGNEALTGAVAVPACMSGAMSVGAVYPDAFSLVTWGSQENPFCQDRSVSPDTVTCFSNSASGLSLFAPGAFWVADTRGGGSAYFSGTSASAPAAAGSAVLLREARPELSASGIASLLRASGRPITDSRNGVRAPRVDALAAVRLPTEDLAISGETPADVPPGGAASVRAEVSGYAGSVASVQADVSVLADDPRALTLTLAGPDGTSVRLHDRTGFPEHALRGVYGATLASAQSLGAFQGKPPNGTWTLTASAETGSTPARILAFAVRVVPGQPREPIAAGSAAQVLPLVGRVQGTKLFLSDARLYNPSSEPRDVSLFYVAQGLSGASAVKAAHTVAPGEMLVLDDVVGGEFGYSDSIGGLTLAGADSAGLIVSSRAYTTTSNGSFGQLVPGFRTSSAIGPGGRATANGLAKNARFHVNAGFVEVSGSPVTVRMEIYSAAGALLSAATRTAPANATVLVSDLITARGLGVTENFRLDFTVTSTSGRVVPFAALVDDGTGDGVFVSAETPTGSEGDRLIAQASHATGGGGDVFRTDLHLTNAGSAPQAVTLSLVPRVVTGGPASPRSYTIPAGATLQLTDVLASEFGLGDPSAAGIRVHAAPGARLVVGSRTYVERAAGTLGFSIPGLPESAAIGAGDGAAASIQLSQSRDARTNFGFAEVAGADAVVRVEARSAGGGVLGAKTYTVRAGESLQAASPELIGIDVPARDMYLRFEVVAGSGRVLAYGVAVDNASGDAIYVPAIRESEAALPH